MNERVRELRKTLGMTLDKFGERLGIKKAAVSKIEKGENALTDSNIKSICREFNVNEFWLRDGTGEMFQKLERKEEIAKLATDLFKGEKDSFKERLIMALARLDEREWELLEQIAEKLEKEED